MLEFNALQELVMSHIGMIEIDRNAIIEARSRAARFLVIQSHLNDHLKILDDVMVKASTQEKASYAQAILVAPGKNVTEQKVHAEADPMYVQAREACELVKSEHNWTKRHYEIFENAHVMFRQIAAEKG
jgi:hypothetical protein